MRIKLITKWSKGVCWAYCNYNDDVLIECGKTAEDVRGKIMDLLRQYHNINGEEIQFLIQTTGVTKAQSMIKRLKKDKSLPTLSVDFNTDYFR